MTIVILRGHGSPRRRRNMPGQTGSTRERGVMARHKVLVDDAPWPRHEPGWAQDGIAQANDGMEIGL